MRTHKHKKMKKKKMRTHKHEKGVAGKNETKYKPNTHTHYKYSDMRTRNYVSSYFFTCVLIRVLCVLILLDVSAYYYICAYCRSRTRLCIISIYMSIISIYNQYIYILIYILIYIYTCIYIPIYVEYIYMYFVTTKYNAEVVP